ncbi:hypothetical protein K439DRAFT_1418542 [Ramaria rubella]|nr:hypothetical protein K439DRAFT_1418542 [Ramaria rubella]
MSNDLAILSSHLSTLLEARSVSQQELDPLVAYAIAETQQDGRSQDTRRAQWEYLLKNEVFKLAATEGDELQEPAPRYFDELKSRLDLVLAFTEHDVCDASFPFSVLEDLLETQTVASCWHIFSWIEERTERLTTNMIPAKGKSLVLLRTLNDLLRRLSKTGKNTMFCGRILIFLSSVFSLGERSGVNLRGDYGPQWDSVVPKAKEVPPEAPADIKQNEDEDVKMEGPEKEGETQSSEVKMKLPPSEKTEEEKKEDFYQTFWSLQLPFSRPPLFAHMISFESFKDSVNAVLPVIAEATKKERAMMGSKVVTGNLKRKREPTPPEAGDDAGQDYFFAKFLTSPELLDLEIADTLFRRQFLFQLLILIQHLLHFTQAEKAKWAVQRNRSLHMDFTLSASDAKWAQDTWEKAIDELKATTPNGKAFSDTVAAVLERERNWIKWKNDLCPPFDKGAMQPSLEEQTREKRRTLMEPTPAWRYKWGTEALTETWETGFQSVRDCENPPGPGELKDFAKRIKQTDARIEMRKKQLTRLAVPKPVNPIPVPISAPAPAPAAVSMEHGAKVNTSQDSVPLQDSQLVTTQASAPAHTPASSPAVISPPTAKTPGPAAPTPVVAPATGVTSLHPSLPPRPGVSPAPFNKPQTPNRSQAPPTPTPILAPPPLKQDDQLRGLLEQKDRLSWLALRRARTEHMHLFGKIGTGDVDMLMTAVEQEKEKEAKLATDKLETLMQPPLSTNTNAETPTVPASGVNGDTKQDDGLGGTLTITPNGEAPAGAVKIHDTPGKMEIDS